MITELKAIAGVRQGIADLNDAFTDIIEHSRQLEPVTERGEDIKLEIEWLIILLRPYIDRCDPIAEYMEEQLPEGWDE